jgi:hypothetical protein
MMHPRRPLFVLSLLLLTINASPVRFVYQQPQKALDGDVEPLRTKDSSTFVISRPDAAAPGPDTHLSAWSKAQKDDFLHALDNDQASDWTIVMGNEGGGPT